MVFAPNANASIFSKSKSASLTIQATSASKEVQAILADLQNALKEQNTKSANENYLNYQYEQDKQFILRTLKSNGYYQSTIEGSFNEETKVANFLINSGAQYHFGKIKLTLDKARNQSVNIPNLSTLLVKTGSPAITTKVLEDEGNIRGFIENNNCLFKYEVSNEAIINHMNKEVDITYNIKAGANAVFGDILLTGQKTINNSYLEKYIHIENGECFKRSKVNDAKLSLQKSGLLARAEPLVAPTLPQNRTVPITFEIKERAQRSITAGASYSTDIGAGVSGGWEHRNFFSNGEKLSTTASLSLIEQNIGLQLEKPFFLRDNQRLKLASTIKQEDNDAFRTTGVKLSGGIERDLTNKWIAGIGSAYDLERVKDQNNTENIALLTIPVFVSQDKRDNILNPSKGWSFGVNTSPSVDTIDTNTAFLKNRIHGSYYKSFSTIGKPVFAVRSSVGSITGVSTDTIPATERFYSGGGSSIRGYSFQKVGPLDSKNAPLGGRSIFEISNELRFRLTDSYGLVTFVDGGNVFDSTIPDFKGGMLWGAGVGIRYYTGFGPLRFDIATPLRKRIGVDDSFQLYFSIGQAF